MERGTAWGMALGLLLLFCLPAVSSGGEGVGVGVSFDRSVPVLGLGERYPASQKVGVVLDYRLSERTALEFEYHHAMLKDGRIERKAFLWGVDKQRYLSPQAKSEMNLNGFLVNALVRLRRGSGTGMELAPYLAVGAGFYDYQDTISGLIYPGQKVTPLNPALLLEPRKDDHTSLGATFGLGMEVAQGRFGLDVRARYHMVLGELRPMEAWGFGGVFPLGLVDVSTVFKVYFR